MSVPIRVQPKQPRTKRQRVAQQRVEGITALGGVFIILGVTALVAAALIVAMSISMFPH